MTDCFCDTATAKSSLALDQNAAQISNIYNTDIISSCNDFDITDVAYLLFDNIKPCEYLSPSSFPAVCNNGQLFLLHLNIRSLAKNYDLADFLSKFTVQPHVITLTETKIKDRPLGNISIPGCTFFHVDSNSNAGGVGAYIFDSLQASEILFDTAYHGCECLWIKLTCPGTDLNYSGTVYRHPKTNMNEFLDMLDNILTDLNNNHTQYFILGNMNINTLNNYSSKCTQDYLNMLSSNCTVNLIDKPSRVTPSSGTIIDHILTNDSKHHIIPLVFDYDITDHYPVAALIDRNLAPKRSESILVRSFTKSDCSNFNNDLFTKLDNFMSKINAITESNINDIFNSFYSLLTSIINAHAPLKKLTRKQKRLKNKPWITKGLLIATKRKQKMHKTHYINGSSVA